MKKVVALAGDYKYIKQIETTIKSLVFHNKFVKIYIFNEDIPREWFVYYRHLLQMIGSDLIDIKLIGVGLDSTWQLNHNLYHINYMTFARYFIPKFIEEDTVLYLDSDLIITRDIEDLFNMDISDKYLAGARAAFGLGPGFNAGVMLINNKRWKLENICEKLVDLTNKEHHNVPEGDQTILNMVLGHNYLLISDTYNYHIGYDGGANNYGHRYLFEIPLSPLPAILHYVSADKPWKTYSSGRLREIWWQYALMDWSNILNKWSDLIVEVPVVHKKKSVTLTNTLELAHIQTLVENCPNIEFHICAFTNMAPELLRLASYENVILHPHVLGMVLEQMIKECDLYLNIDCSYKDKYFMDLVKEHNKLVLSFDYTQSEHFNTYDKHRIFSNDDVNDLTKLLNKM